MVDQEAPLRLNGLGFGFLLPIAGHLAGLTGPQCVALWQRLAVSRGPVRSEAPLPRPGRAATSPERRPRSLPGARASTGCPQALKNLGVIHKGEAGRPKSATSVRRHRRG